MPRHLSLALALMLLALAGSVGAQEPALTPESAKQLTLDAATTYRAGDPARALTMLDRALAFLHASGDHNAEEEALYARGIVLRAQGQHTQALQAFQAAHALNRATQNEGEALLLHEIGLSQLDLGHYADAENAFSDERTLQTAAGDVKAEAEALHNAAFALGARAKTGNSPEQIAQALQRFEEAVALRRKAADVDGLARTLEFVAQMQLVLGKAALAVDPAQQAAAAFKSLGDAQGLERATTLLAQAQAGVARGDHAAPPTERQRERSSAANDRHNDCVARLQANDAAGARKLCDAARQMFADSGDRAGEAMALVTLGFVDVMRSDYDRARESLGRGLQLARETGSRSQTDAINLMGVVDMATGRLPQALSRFELALAAYEKRDDLDNQNRVRNNIAGLLVALGRLDEAAAAYQPLLRGPGVNRAQTLTNLAAVQAMRKAFPEARALLQEAVALQRRTQDPLLRTGLGNLGSVQAESGDAAAALPVLQEALALDRQAGDRASESGTLLALAEVQARLGHPPEALALFAQAAELARTTGVGAALAMALGGSARVLEAQGRLDKAAEAYLQAIAIDEELRRAGGIEEFRTALADRAVDRQQRAARLLLKLQRPAEAFEMAERSRARSLLDQLGSVRIETGSDDGAAMEQRIRLEMAALNRLIGQQRARPVSQRDEAALTDLQSKLAQKRQEHERALLGLKAANAEHASLVTVAPPTLAELQALLDADTTLLSYLVTPDAVLAFMLSKKELHAVELPVGEAALRALVEELRAALGAPGEPPLAALQRLSALLVDPLRAHLQTARLGIVPHGVLHLLPFAALRGGASGAWLGEQFELFQLPSASVLPFLAAKRKPARGPLLALAQAQAPGLPPLRQAEVEARAVAAVLGGTVLTGAAASEAALRQRVGTTGVLHIAAHGQLNAAAPLFSRLVLAGDDDLDTARDGMLEVREVFGLDLHQASLVVLSACQTELGALSRGDDMVGLSRAFLYAGAPTVVASLWKVDDAATAALMSGFYAQLDHGLGPAAALRAAQVDARGRDPDPFKWAAFVLTGDPGAPK